MYRLFVILFFLLFLGSSSFSQESPYQTNLWASVLLKHHISSKYSFSFDVGYRTFDGFILKTRQKLVRSIFERKLGENHSIGIGIAYFETISSKLNHFIHEVRPTIQYQFEMKKNREKIGIRLRDEFRFFNTNSIYQNRIRLQGSYEYSFSKMLNPKVMMEGFLTFQKKEVIEERFTIGNTFLVSNWLNINLFYILQYQSNIILNNKRIPQNIVGFQLIINTKRKARDEKR